MTKWYVPALFALCLLPLSTPLLANQADWVMVDRFNSQLADANKGKLEAMYQVGLLFERGRGTNKDMSQAASWFQKAAENGHSGAKARLGIMYVEGRGVSKNLATALKLIREAANDNIASAQYQLASMYEQGIGLSPDNDSAISWYKKAAANGYFRAEEKIKTLNSAPAKPAAAPRPLVKTAKPSKPALSPVLQQIQDGNWLRNKNPVGYLPSPITNCRINNDELSCVSTAQERDTGNEIISYNTESTVSNVKGKEFVINYINNVLEVDVHARENGDGELVKPAKSSIKTGKQEKVHHLSCTLVSNVAINCTKNGRRELELISQK